MGSMFYLESSNQSYDIFHKRFTRTTSISSDFYKSNIESDAKAIHAIITSLKLNQQIASLFASGDRNAILQYVAPLYKELNSNYNITHFYFTGLDRVNILRVHSPERYGDTINRSTTIKAEQSKKLSYGVELGALGTLTLRVVSPWYSNQGEHIGYLELGMEIDHIIDRLQTILGFNIDLFINKKYLEKKHWNEGMQLLARNIDWHQFESLVATKEHTNPIFQTFINKKNNEQSLVESTITPYKNDGSTFWLLSVPITDVQGHNVAIILMLANTTVEKSVIQHTIITVSIAIFLLAGMLLVFFIIQIKQVKKAIQHDENQLKHLATKDPLTGLNSRRVFDHELITEISYSKRYKTKISIVLIDIDHFKLVNDNYGHLAGDSVLREVSDRIEALCREIDIPCRFGGEEFVIIAKNTSAEESKILAERVRMSIETTPFNLSNGERVSVTISAGIALYPDHAVHYTDMISAADQALYKAKGDGRNCVRIADNLPVEYK